MFNFLPHSVLQMSAIFLSIVIEAIPFVLLGCIISGALQVFLTPERVRKILPNNKFLAILVGSFLGFFFPSCECGIVPIVTQFIRKGVPEHTAFAFMVTAPIINPIVLFSTYIAFGNSVKFALLRGIGSLIVALIIGSWIAYFNRTPILKTALHDHSHSHHHHDKAKRESFGGNVWSVLVHGIDEFFDTGRYLIIGALIASSMQVYLPTQFMMQLTSSKIVGILVMLILAFTMSLCSEADAFVGSSLLSLFGTNAIVAFLVFGSMVDIKNLMMMKRSFHGKFILQLIALISVIVTIYALVL
ncbi:permease [Enterococcus raffinosus]|uniref:ABC transporter membrane protein n=1 Tax=Enterococcus raffinosus ATCC 49464 TaxID=1158602 RepID=R2RN77_9ENTE|nr:permease [Enterococcus raffinosus]EOH81991.1 ABC transporter membrane protein [Enterococcus raffinosus ATCC 49464]EOT78172.1 ABC transporter membrane protein [Enterococcus raffinosus ATCC 49464]UXK06328.1 permease [Enterococcus raffinosus]